MSNDRISDQLRYMTVRILTSKQEDTNWTGSGTGFLYMFANDDKQAPFLVTNKHVIDDAVVIGLTFHVTIDNNETPLPGCGRLISFRSCQTPLIRHPDSDVDLAAIGIVPIFDHAVNHEGWCPYIKCLDKTFLPSAQMISDFSAIEDLVMVGYPTGLVDAVNNFPVVRRGITSTPYITSYQGKQEFLADIPVYGGSSGSPIFLMNEGSWSTANGLAMGTRFALLGVLYAGHTETVNGDIVAEPIPTNIMSVARVKHMINLGLCIKSALIEDLATQIPGW
jgi:Trypsin-like peptidase domain